MHIVRGLLRLLLIAFLASCTSVPTTSQTSPKEIHTKEPQVQTLRPKIQSRLERREFLCALQLMQQEVNSGQTETSFAKEYAVALRGGMNYSEELLSKRLFSECGIYIKKLLNLYPRSLSTISGVSTEQLQQRLNYCSDQLMAKGLAEYRAGQMEQAINYWTALLVFNPERTEAQKAIKTCSTQLRNLNKKP